LVVEAFGMESGSGSHVGQQNYGVSLRRDLPAISFCIRKIGRNGNLQDDSAITLRFDGVSMATGIFVAHARGSQGFIVGIANTINPTLSSAMRIDCRFITDTFVSAEWSVCKVSIVTMANRTAVV
jgi:hypothetical protein